MSHDAFTETVREFLKRECNYSEHEAQRLLGRYASIVKTGRTSVSFTPVSTALALERADRQERFGSDSPCPCAERLRAGD
jgi:hypothetical protein